jgi:hypothetical protein
MAYRRGRSKRYGRRRSSYGYGRRVRRTRRRRSNPRQSIGYRM